MGRTAFRVAVALTLAVPFASLAPPSAPAQPGSGTPHAFLFGAWTGGLFPPPSSLTAQECLAQPTVIFTRDVVMHATLTDVQYVQRAIETARGTGNGIDFRFAPVAAPQPSPAGLGTLAPGQGFGCEGADDLHVTRISPNQIRFPGCRDFPFPLVRCPAA